jgi:hypothetical protein
VHEHLLKEYGAELFPEDSGTMLGELHFKPVLNVNLPDISESDEEVVLFSRQIESNDEDYLNHFSCPSSNKRGLHGQVIVIYEGADDGTGNWTCTKNLNSPCAYLSVTKRKFLELVQHEPGVCIEDDTLELDNQAGACIQTYSRFTMLT